MSTIRLIIRFSLFIYSPKTVIITASVIRYLIQIAVFGYLDLGARLELTLVPRAPTSPPPY